jgi:predicted nucleotidyltransferase
MSAEIQRLMTDLKIGLSRIYGGRLKAVILFGSYARGDNDASSDVDVMIVLESFQSYWQELVRTAKLASDLSLEYGMTISRTLMTEQQWHHADMPILRNVRAEGVVV